MMEMTRALAWAAATDAGNRNMQLAGRQLWNEEDYNVAATEFERLWPDSMPYCAPDSAQCAVKDR